MKTNFLSHINSGKHEQIDQIILSVGTNDISRVKNVDTLEGPLNDLITTMKSAYPSCDIYVQNLLPIRLKNYECDANVEIVNKVYAFNRLLFKICKSLNLFYIDVFKSFRSNGKPGERGIRNDLYKSASNVHLNHKGLGVLARRFIYIINKHSWDFHPTKF